MSANKCTFVVHCGIRDKSNKNYESPHMIEVKENPIPQIVNVLSEIWSLMFFHDPFGCDESSFKMKITKVGKKKRENAKENESESTKVENKDAKKSESKSMRRIESGDEDVPWVMDEENAYKPPTFQKSNNNTDVETFSGIATVGREEYKIEFQRDFEREQWQVTSADLQSGLSQNMKRLGLH